MSRLIKKMVGKVNQTKSSALPAAEEEEIEFDEIGDLLEDPDLEGASL